jgi:EAL domain-containing protein (putative c-di-GMP-specific phosphodiesterase class I)
MAAFEEAHRSGTGPHLEAAAIRAALAQRPPTGLLSINVSLDALTSAQVQEALAGDLTGVMLEITEHTDPESFTDLAKTLKALRKRGAVIAIDDWGQGFSNLDRLLRLRPDVVKLDISLIQSLDSDYHREVVRSVTSWADAVGVRVCAEGIETEHQWRILQELGVHMGQGYFFGRPAAPELEGGAEAAEELVLDAEL